MPSSAERTALIVVVPEADARVRNVRLRHDSSAARGVPAHITLLLPFAPRAEIDEEALAHLFAGHVAFDFILDRVEHWDDGIPWLHPEPSEPFESLTIAIWERWPDWPPYEGAHKKIVPHLTVSEEPIHVELELPIHSRASAVSLIEEAPDGTWSTRRVFRLG